jgi:hypothetical protein
MSNSENRATTNGVPNAELAMPQNGNIGFGKPLRQGSSFRQKALKRCQQRSDCGRYRYRERGKWLIRNIDPDTDSDSDWEQDQTPSPKPSYQPSG